MINIWENRNFKPMLLNEINKPFNSKDYIYELKFDGVRALLFVNSDSIYIQSRNKNNLTYLFPEFSSIKSLVNKNVIFDGEIVFFENGKPLFSEVLKRIRLKDNIKISSMCKNNPVTFVVFDILYENKNLTNLPLIERKKYLNKYKENDCFVKVKFIEDNGIAFFNNVKKLGLEGIVAKDKRGKYHINERTDDFLKIKNLKTGDFLIGGYEIKKSGVMSLFIGEYENERFYFVGKVKVYKSNSIYDLILSSKNDKNYFFNFNEKINYVKPVIRCTVKYLEKTKNNYLRHPVFKSYKGDI